MEISKNQTKEWRKSQLWYITGKSNECEKFQKLNIESLTRKKLNLTYDRINIENSTVVECRCPLKNKNGFEFTENFDGVQFTNCKKLYYNLKFVCDSGGAQTRTLRETYHFIKHQIIISNSTPNTYYINILDGDSCHSSKNKFEYLLEKAQNKNVFIGDTVDFYSWYKNTFN
jgi:hypothetical protein